jgi:carbonic anhydrase
MVLGHTSCGAVKATAAGGHVEGHLASVVKGIEPAVKAVKARGAAGPAVAPAAEEENVRLNALALLRKNPVVRKLAAQGKLKVTPAIYDLSTGEVRLLDLEPSLKAERKARVGSVKGLLAKFKGGYLEDSEKASLLAGLAELLPELN